MKSAFEVWNLLVQSDKREKEMSVAIWVEDQSYELGSPSFMRCFFSTVLVRLEQGRWGSRFPIIMNEFSMGGLAYEHADQAQNELIAVQTGLEAFRPSEVVWNYEHPDVAPPWGDRISPAITSLANYFWTSDGKEMFKVIQDALADCKHRRRDIRIE
jgi:2,3-bisphosphoglycerate-dependent phosphoglycerate mutase